MAAMDFPNPPLTVGQLYPPTPVAGIPQYKWDGTAWVAVLATEMQNYVRRTGDTMTGLLTLSGDPTVDLHAVPKRYVDGGVAGIPGKVSKAGDTMTGLLTLSGDPTAVMHAATRQYVDLRISVVRQQNFTASGTYTPHAKMLFCHVRMTGAGGSGGGAPNPGANQTSVGSGGGSGGYVEKLFSKAEIGVSQVVTIGAGAVGAVAGNGAPGGNTTFGALLTANGGGGGGLVGPITSAGQVASGGGGTASGGDINVSGTPGEVALALGGASNPLIFPGNGGSGPLGGGGKAAIVNTGGNGGGYGAGGGGASSFNAAGAAAGGAGSNGGAFITEYCSS